MTDSYVVTGALGCIGSWVVKQLSERGDTVTVFDTGGDARRIHDVTDATALARVRFVTGDVTDFAAVKSALQQSGARKLIHLAGLQVPFCRADPARGARVNVLGSIHLFQASLELGLERVVYASSAAVYGPDPDASDDNAAARAPDEDAPCVPTTHYGVYKRANEGNALIYWEDSGLSSVGLRPLTVYGVGRDQGLTSGPTSAMKAAVLGRPFTIGFSGATDFNYVADTAAAFIACADEAPEGAHVFNLHGDTAPVSRVVEIIRKEAPQAREIAIDGPELPIPPALDGDALRAAIPSLPHTPLEAGIRETMARFRALHEAGRLDTRDLSGG